MEKQFEILTATRKNALNVIDGLSLEQINLVPSGFKNNIIWNVAHMVVTQQLLCYKLAKLEMKLENEFVDRYKKGSEVKTKVDKEEFEWIKKMLLELPIQLVKDYNNEVFKNYSEYPTSYNVLLTGIEDAIQFNNTHEGLHLGYIMAMKKLV